MGRLSRTPAALLVGLALVAALVLVWFVVVGLVAQPPSPAPSVYPGTRHEGDAAGTPGLAGRTEDGAGGAQAGREFPHRTAGAGMPAGPAPSDGVDPARVGVAAVLDVVVDAPEAWLADGQLRVYALPAGAPGVGDAGALPTARVAAGRATLRLPTTGRWDVGVISSFGATLATDVAVPSADPVVITVRAAPIVLRFDGEADVEATHPRVRTPKDVDGVTFPGRGERRRVFFDMATADEPLATPPVPTGRRFQIRWHGPDWEPESRFAFAGQTVVFHRVPTGTLEVDLSLATPVPDAWRAAWSSNPWTAIYVQRSDWPKDERRYVSTWLQKDGSFDTSPLTVELPAGDYALLGGVGRVYRDHHDRFSIRPSATTRLEVPLVLARESPFTHTPAPGGGYDVVFDVQGASSGRLDVFVETARAEEVHLDEHGTRLDDRVRGDGVQVHTPGGRPRAAFAVRHPDRASGWFSMPRRGRHDLVLRPAGMLVVVVAREPAEGLGRLVLRAADGRPLPYAEPDDDEDEVEIDAAPTVAARTGLRIGPLPVGPHRFEVRLGGVVVGEARATVRAGALRPLTIDLDRTVSR